MKKLQKQQTTLKTSKHKTNLWKEPRHSRTFHAPPPHTTPYTPLMAQGTQIQSEIREQEKAVHFPAKIPGSFKLLPQAWIF